MSRHFLRISILSMLLAASGCIDNEITHSDMCPDDPDKTDPGICGCGISDDDTDGDTIADCNDRCPDDSLKTEPGQCGCGTADTDSDGDAVPDCHDNCPDDPNKSEPGVCGCGMEEDDINGDTIPDCIDDCPDDPAKTRPGICGCGVPDDDTDGDATPDCFDRCKDDPDKIDPGICGCGNSEADTDGDAVPDCEDLCLDDPDKIAPGFCGCGHADTDSDGDTLPDCIDQCPNNREKTIPGICGCDLPDSEENIGDNDADGVHNCIDECPDNPYKITKTETLCEIDDTTDTDGDTIPDVKDACPYNPDISTGEGGDRCNIVIENGIEIFNIYHINELAAFKASQDIPAEGTPCTAPGTVKCHDGAPNTALMCNAKNRYEIIACGTCTTDADGTDTCPFQPATDAQNPGELCDPAAFNAHCTDGSSITACVPDKDNTHHIIEKKCSGSHDICNAEMNSCQNPVPENPVPSAGDPGASCDINAYQKTCSEAADSIYKCIQNKVTAVPCITSCRVYKNSPNAYCAESSAKDVKHVRLMNDIDLNELYETADDAGTLKSSWTPLNLNHIDFDGNGKTIKHKKIDIENSLFGNVINSSVHDLNIEYNASAKSIFADIIENSSIDHIAYSGQFRQNSPSDTSSAFIRNSIGSSIKDIIIQSPSFDVSSSSVLLNSAENTDIKNVDVHITNIYGKINSSIETVRNSYLSNVKIYIDNIKLLANSVIFAKTIDYKSEIDGLTLDIGTITPLNNSDTISAVIFKSSSGNLKNLNIHINSIDSLSFTLIDNLANAALEYSNFQIASYTSKQSSSGSLFINQCSNSNIDHLNYTLNNAESHSSVYVISYLNSTSKITNSTFDIGNIKIYYSIYIIGSLYGLLDSSSININRLESGNYPVNIFSYFNGTINNSNIDVKKMLTKSDSIQFIDNCNGTITNSTFKCDHMQNTASQSSSYQLSAFHSFNPKQMKNVSVYANMYTKNNGRAGFSYQISPEKLQNVENIVSSVTTYSYTTSDSDGIAADSTLYSKELITHGLSSSPAEIIQAANFFYLKRSVNDTEFPSNGSITGKITVTPYSHNGISGTQTVDSVLTKLGSGWIKKTITEKSGTIQIPWYDNTPK